MYAIVDFNTQLAGNTCWYGKYVSNTNRNCVAQSINQSVYIKIHVDDFMRRESYLEKRASINSMIHGIFHLSNKLDWSVWSLFEQYETCFFNDMYYFNVDYIH